MDDFLIESQDDLIKVTNPVKTGHLDDEENYKSHSQVESSSHQEDFEHFPDDDKAAPPTPPPSSNLDKYDSSLLDFDAKSDFPGGVLPAAAPKTEQAKNSTMAFIESEKQDERNIEDDYLNPYAASNKYGNDEKPDKFISSEDLLGSFSPEHKSAVNKNASSDVEAVHPVEPEHVPQPTPPAPKPEPVVAPPKSEPAPVVVEKKVVAVAVEPEPKLAKVVDSDKVVKMFKQAGLDAWFQPERLHPKVESLIYWRDPKKSGIVFGIGLALLLAMSIFSLISVFAYVSLLSLVGTLSFRIYKAVLQAIHKTNEGHPFKEYLELDLTLSQDKLNQVTSVAVAHLNAIIGEFRRLFLVEDLVDSIKFGAFLWFLTYVGAMFNGMTLIILAFVALFTLPKVYENNKQSIDSYLDMVRTRVSEITDKVKAAVPIGKKTETDKEK